MKVLFVADLHIKLGQKNVPRDWQRNRFMLLAEALNNVKDANTLVIAGDLLDVAKPSLEEVGLLYDFLNALDHRILLIPGNHEMDTKTLDCYRHITGMLDSLDVHVIRTFTNKFGFDFIPYNVLHAKSWGEPQSKLAITHVRGAIPPHVEPEIPLEKFSEYTKVFAGDLHSVTNSQGNIYYPGSPFTTSFHRGVLTGANGYFVIDPITGDHTWEELKLPQLVREKASAESDMVASEYHHTIYELEGSLEELAKVSNSDLLDKKVTTDISAPASLNMSGDMGEELAEFLINVKDMSEDEVPAFISLFKETVLDQD